MSPSPDPIKDHDGGSLPIFNNGMQDTIVIGGASSSEEDENTNAGIVPGLGEYMPLSCGPDVPEDSDSEIDYSSLSGVLSALHTHGPNTLEDDVNEGTNHTNTQTQSSTTDNQIEVCSTIDGSRISREAEQEREAEYSREQAKLWSNPSVSQETEIKLDQTKVEEIRSAMAGFKLPTSAIPPWAMKLSDKELDLHISKKIFGPKKEDDVEER